MNFLSALFLSLLVSFHINASALAASGSGSNCSLEFSETAFDEKRFTQPILKACINEINNRSSKHDSVALLYKSQLALLGLGERKSRRSARIALETAVDAGSIIARRYLADMFINKIGADREDFLKAEGFYLAAIKNGDTKSNERLAQLYLDGKIPNKTAQDARLLFEKAGQGNADTALGKAKALLKEGAGQTNLRQVSQLLEKSAELGNAKAQFMFATLNLHNDDLTEKNSAALQALLCKSAEQGYPAAMLECAKHLLDQAKPGIAIALLTRASDLNHVDSIDYLAKYYSKRTGNKHKNLAIKLWFKAATLGSDAAKLELIYRFDTLSKAQQLNVNGAFKSPNVFKTDVGRIMAANHYLSVVRRGQSGTYIKGEYFYYRDAMNAYEQVAQSNNAVLAKKAKPIARKLRAGFDRYTDDLKTRRTIRKAAPWIALGAVTIGILALSGNSSSNTSSSSTYQHDSCAGINGLAWYGISSTAIALAGCNPYSFD